MHSELTDFLDAHRGQVKESTYKRYRRNLEQFSQWLREDSTHPHEVSQRDLKRYITYLNKEQDYSPKTARAKFAPIKLYYADETEEGLIAENPAEDIQFSDVAKDRTVIEQRNENARVFLTEDEIEQLVKNVPSPQIRNRTILLFQYHTGLRRQEVADVKLSDLEWDKRRVSVTGKHDNDITAYWQPSLTSLLSTWVKTYRKKSACAEESPYLFVTKWTEKIAGNYINQIIREAAENAGLQEELFTDSQGNTRHRITSHSIRHSFGAHWIQKGGSTAGLQQIFAHTDSETTETYKHMVDEWVREEAEQVGVGEDLDLSPTIVKEECEICGVEASTIDHHYSYDPPKTMNICYSCDKKIVQGHYPEYAPDITREEAEERGLLD